MLAVGTVYNAHKSCVDYKNVNNRSTSDRTGTVDGSYISFIFHSQNGFQSEVHCILIFSFFLIMNS